MAILRAAGVSGGVYLTARYIQDRIEDARADFVRDRAAKDNLRRRFAQTQEDVTYTVTALLTTLASQMGQEMDIQPLTAQLQAMRTTLSSPANSTISELPRPSSSSSSSMAAAAHVVAESMPSLSVMQASHTSWIVPNAAPSEGAGTMTDSIVSISSGTGSEGSAWPSTDTSHSEPVSASVSSAASVASHDSPPPQPPAPLASMSKAELWTEIKLVSLTRAITTLYVLNMLTLLTSTQLSLLARRRYVTSIKRTEREERQRESSLSVVDLIIASVLPPSLSPLPPQDLEAHDLELDDDEDDEDTELPFLALSWHILHVGWRDLASKVRQAVESAFQGISLKTKLAPADIKRLLLDIRQRLEWEHLEVEEGVRADLLLKPASFIQYILPSPPSPSAIPEAPNVLSSSSTYPPAPYPARLTPPPATVASPHARYTSLQSTSSKAKLPTPLTRLDILTLQTRDLVNSTSFASALSQNLDHAGEAMVDGVFGSVLAPSSSNIIADPDAERVRLASLLPAFSQWARDAVEGLPSAVVDGLCAMRPTTAWSAIVFAGFEEELDS